MKIISFEGLDKAGKHSQCNLLYERLTNDGFRVIKSEFHRYDTPTGQLIMKWLKREWNVSQEAFELIVAADKQAQQEWFQQLENEQYDFLILDRYNLSQIVYGIANGMDGRWLMMLQKNMRKSDMDIIIDIPVEVSMSRKGKYGENDKYESDYSLLSKVKDLYRHTSIVYSAPIRVFIDGTKPIEEVGENVYQTVKDYFIKR